MKRRSFVAGGLAGILAAGAAPVAHAGQATRWRLVSRLPKTMDIAHAGVQSFVRQVRGMTDGRFEITVQSADEVAANAGVIESVQRGSVECGHTSAAYYVAKDETFALDSAIPFGLDARRMNAWMQQGNGLALLREFYREHGIVNFPMGNTGAQMGGWYRKPLRAPADLKGLRMRMLGLGSRVFERLGGKPVYLSSNETFAALQRGSIDAAEWSAPHDDLRLGLHDHCKYYAHPGWWKGSAQFSLYVNRRAFEALTDENQAIVEAAAAAVHLEIQAQYDAKNSDALEQFVATGTRLVPTPKAVLDAAWQATQELYAELAARNPQWRRIHASQSAFLRDQAWDHAEAGFAAYMHERQMKALAAARQKSAPAIRR
jgi:TRAP-type mannitol/chloroaromatic compound transport system substrate-binding protein